MQVFDENILCAKCNYRLKGLRDPGACPDCGNLYSVARNKGILRPRSTQGRMNGTAVMVAFTTGLLSLVFCPCTGFAWLFMLKSGKPSPALKFMPIVMSVVALGLIFTCLVAAGMAAKEWWDAKKELSGGED
jgi:hypothetical protein